jgi:hypothetical protein
MPGEFIARQGLISRGNVVVTGSLSTSGSLTTTGTITATTLVVQTITSSISSITGSTNFGSLSSDTHKFTGSLNVTGSLSVVTTGTEFQVTSTGVNLGNTLTDSHVISGSVRINPNGLFVSGSGLVGIGTTSPEGVLTIQGTSAQPPTSSTTANSLLQLVGSLNNQLNIGSNTSAGGYGSYIQASDNNLAVPYSLNLQPNGGNVGIGTSTPLDTFVVSGTGGAILERFSGATVYSGDLYFYSARGTSASPTAKINGDTTMGIRPRAYDGTSYLDVASITSTITGAVSTNVMYGSLIFSTNNGGTSVTERMRITSAGVLDLPYGQIKFPASQNASADANTLDDYEEGTWTPVPTSTGATFQTTVNGTYTKIGRLVYITCQLDNSNPPTGTLTNEMTITGLPFTSSTTTGYGASLAIGFEVYIDYPAGGLNIQARIPSNTTQITLRFTIDDNSGGDFLASNFDFGDARIALAGCYEV